MPRVIRPDVFRIAFEKVGCPLCKVKAGEDCILLTGRFRGKKASTLHNERLRAAGFGSAMIRTQQSMRF